MKAEIIKKVIEAPNECVNKNQNFLVKGKDSGKLFIVCTLKETPISFYSLISLDSKVENRTETVSTIQSELGYEFVNNETIKLTV